MDAPSAPAWHALSAPEVSARRGTDREAGMDPAEARRRLAEVGPNRVAAEPETPLWRLALDQFRSLVVLLLLAAAAVAAALGERLEALPVLPPPPPNPPARVRRGGRVVRRPAAELVPGDIVVLEAGAQVPADLRLIETAALRLGEAP